MKKYLLVLAAMAMGAVACTSDPEAVEGTVPAGSDNNAANSNLTTVQLASFASSQTRVVLEPQTKTLPVPGSLELFATIENLSAEQGRINGFAKEEENGRYLSATCVYYDNSTKTYYVTYHMQGNNYNTELADETSGYIETFTLDDNGVPTVGKVYQAANPSALDFDFNHLYFDDLSNADNSGTYNGKDTGVRVIAVGHTSRPTASGKTQTEAMIAKLDLEGETLSYAPVLTGAKILDENGKSLGNEDAGDVNCVLRKYNYYYLATRKGIAVLNAKDNNMFTPVHNLEQDENGKYYVDETSTYFVRTPGSAKHVAHYYPAYGSGFSFLYLTEPTPAGYDGNTKLPASIINFSMDAGSGTLCGMNSTDSQKNGKAILSSADFDITAWSTEVNQMQIPDYVYPVDGKNVLYNLDGRLYACLGKGGLYVRRGAGSETLTFTDVKDGSGSRPVNGVFVEDLENYNDGFIYVANGACLTILDRETLEKVAEYSAFDPSDEAHLASANYVHVYKTGTYTGKCPDRLVTVAYGQAGVKVFKFVPPSR